MFKEQLRMRDGFISMAALCVGVLTLLSLGVSRAAADPTSAAFVQKAYLDLMLRPATSSDISTWTALLDSASLTHTQFALDVMNSDEYRHVRVKEFFGDFLSRAPDSLELSSLTTFLQSNPLPQGRATILGSAEYFSSQGGSSNAGFLGALYLDLLGRAIDAPTSAFFQGQISGGATRFDVAMAVQGGDEWRGDIVGEYYQQFLHRAPDSNGLNVFKGVLSGGGSEQDVIAAILGSEEYLQGVPEPAAIWLLAVGMMGVGRRRS